MKSDIVILGESHTRSYNNVSKIYPFFLSSGRSVNLDTNHIDFVQQQILKVKNKIGDNCTFITKLGEPNIRYQLNNDWYVHIDKKFKYEGKIDYKYLDQCVENYKNMIDKLGFIDYIISPTTAYNPSFESMEYFNNKLKQTFDNMLINIYPYTIQNGKFKEEYKARDSNYDPIHLNSKISDLLLSELVKKDKIFQLENYSKLSGEFDNKDIANERSLGNMLTANKFGTYSI